MDKKIDNLKKAETSQPQPSHKDGKPIRYASKMEFDRALQKVRMLHAGLIKRLAE